MDTSTALVQTSLPHPALIMVRGLPGSGKSYLAQALKKTLGPDTTLILDPDTIDTADPAYSALCTKLTAQGVEAQFFPNRFLKQLGYEAIDSGKIIIWNQAFTNLHGLRRSAGSLQEYAASQHIPLPVLVVEVTIDEATAKNRVAARVQAGGHNVDDDNFQRFIRDYTSFADQGFETVEVSGQNDIQLSVAAVIAALHSLS